MKNKSASDRKTYQQMGAIIGAGVFMALTLLVWAIASIGLVAWLLADLASAGIGAVIGAMVFDAHRK